MKTKLFFAFLLSFSLIAFSSCEDDDDDDSSQPSTSSTSMTGSGNGAGTGGGTGSGGIPPNSMQANVDGVIVMFDSLSSSSVANQVSIIGNQKGNNVYPQISISFSDSLSIGRYDFPGATQPSITYTADMNTTYFTSSGRVNLQTNDKAQKLANGRFNIVVKNAVDQSDSLIITSGQFNNFYN